MVFDVYSTLGAQNESLVVSTGQLQEGNTQLRVNTLRWSDKSFLGYKYVAPNTHLMACNAETGVTTEIFQLPQSEGTYISSVEPTRCHSGASENIAMQVSERNGATGRNMNRLLLFRNGSETAEVLLSASFNDGHPIPKMQPLDVSADGRVVALTAQGMVISSGVNQFVIARSGLSPTEACFSPDGKRIAYSERAGSKPGWKIRDLTTASSVPIPELDAYQSVRWSDDTHVIATVGSGPERRIDWVDLVTGTTTRIAAPGARSNTMINDFGVN